MSRMKPLAESQAAKIWKAARDWKAQGPRSRWQTKASLKLWDLIDRAEKKNYLPTPKLHKLGELPKVGEYVHVPSSFYIDRGEDDLCGGRGTVTKVEWLEDYGTHSIEIEEIPGHGFFWENNIKNQQAALRKGYGRKKAHACPDNG